MFGGIDKELRAAFGNNSEPQLSYKVKSSGATLQSQLSSGGGHVPSDTGHTGHLAMAQSLGDMINNPPPQFSSAPDLDKYKNMQLFMTEALCKNNKQSNNHSFSIPDISDLDFLASDQNHRYQNAHHCGFDGQSVDVRPYALAIHDFVPQYENELGFKKGIQRNKRI